jgi:hypothetical protein
MTLARLVACAVLLVLLSAAVVQPRAEAVSGESKSAAAAKPPPAALAKQRISEVFKSEEFKHTEKTTGIRLKKRDVAQKPPQWVTELLETMVKVTKFLAGLGEVLLWALALALIVLIIVLRRTWLPYFGRGRLPRQGPQEATSVGQALPEASLPEDIPGTALARWREGRHAEALSVLYRGALQVAADRLHVPLAAGATEKEALHAVTAAQPSLHDYFKQLTAAWVGLAYAGRDPPEIETLVAGYRRHLEATP